MAIQFTAGQQLRCLERDVLPLLEAVDRGFTYDPGHSDLDDEQPIRVQMTLGDYRRAQRLHYELTNEAQTHAMLDVLGEAAKR